MARISFTSEVEELIGKLGGSVIQDSYFGIQIRGLSKPRNPQTQLQQLRRGDFAFLSASWKNLTPTEQLTWVTEAGTIPEAKRLFIGSNINLLLIGLDIITSWITDVTPPDMPVTLINFDTTVFNIQAQGAVTTVPDDMRLLLFATTDKRQTVTFNNPSSYQPITYFEEGTDLSGITDVFAEWTAHYGVLRADRHICIKSALINKINGSRTDSAVSCDTNPPVDNDFIIDSDGTFIIDYDSSKIIAYE